MPARKPKQPPLAFSYLRFSSAEQAKGDSLRRQVEARDAWVKRNGAVLDQSLTLTDAGVSAFHGVNAEDGDKYALGRFVELVKAGQVPGGSFLLIENLDRLSRQSLRPALTLLLDLLNHGINVVQLSPSERVIHADDCDPLTLFQALMELNRGHSESAMKSDRLAKVWREKKERAAAGTVMTPIVPGWLTVEGGKIVPVPDRVKVVKRIFSDVAAGRGISQVAAALTRIGVPRWGDDPTGPWSSAFVHKVVTSRATLGEYQPRRRVFVRQPDGRTVCQRVSDGEPIPNYYPAVITPAVWQAAQDSLKSRHRGTGKTVSRHWNPFAGWLLDAREGGTMYIKAEARTNTTLVNHAAAKGVPGAVYLSFPADQFITAVLSELREIDPADVAPAGPGDDRAAALADRRERLLARVGALRAELETGDGEVKAAVDALRKLESQLEDVTTDLARARAEAPERTAETWAQARSLIDLLANSPDLEDTSVRLKSALRRTVKEGRVLIVARTAQERKDGRGSVKPRHRLAAVQLWFHTGAVRSYLLTYAPGHARWKVPSSCTIRSLVLPGRRGELDLRRPADVAALERKLLAIPLADLARPANG